MYRTGDIEIFWLSVYEWVETFALFDSQIEVDVSNYTYTSFDKA